MMGVGGIQKSTKIVNGHPNSRIDELLPWAYVEKQSLKGVA
jgi:transposase